MTYLDRTLEVRAAIRGSQTTRDQIRQLMALHVAGNRQPLWHGSRRSVYGIGPIALSPIRSVNVVLKLMNDTTLMRLSRVANRKNNPARAELGAMEAYFDFVAGHYKRLCFADTAEWELVKAKLADSLFFKKVDIQQSFPLSDWPGTSVAVGDLGALPYFQLAVCHEDCVGILTEGLPPIEEPKGTVSRGYDVGTIEEGRIIDMDGADQSLLLWLSTYADLFRDKPGRKGEGISFHGHKYLFSPNRIDI